MVVSERVIKCALSIRGEYNFGTNQEGKRLINRCDPVTGSPSGVSIEVGVKNV